MMKKVLIALSLSTLVMSCSGDDETTTDGMTPDGQSAQAAPGSFGAPTQVGQSQLGQNSAAKPNSFGLPGTPAAVAGAAATQAGVNGQSQAGKPGTPAVNGTQLQTSTAQSVETAPAGSVLYVKTHSLNVRTGPGMSHKVIGVVNFNDSITVKEAVNNGRWIKIGEGQYVGGRYLSTTKNSSVTIPSKVAH